jgi:hypothetical protein
VALRRRTPEVEPEAVLVEDPATGKGRPTPKRSEARKARRTGAAPATRKEAAARLREKNREERRKQRAALVTGDERNLPPRDSGPAKRLARDVVDTRFTYGQVFFGAIAVVFLASLIPVTAVRNVISPIGLLSVVVMFSDGYRNGKRAKDAVVERYGEPAGVGILSYAFMRALLPRRMRRPPPTVNRGDDYR